MKVFIPNNFIPERTYAVHSILNDGLGINIEIHTHDQPHYLIQLNHTKSILVEDAFFSILSAQNYLSLQNIPTATSTWSPFDDVLKVEVLFGNPKMEMMKDACHIATDIFAGAFYMLSRWEEIVIPERDRHERFQAKSSLAYKNGFLKRPIVNEYEQFIKKVANCLGVNIELKHTFNFYLTHDVDLPLFFPTITHKLAKTFKSMVKPKFMPSPIKMIKASLAKADPYDRFDYFMDIAESHQIKSHFFFSTPGNSKYDNKYQIDSNFILDVVQKIKLQQHNIGFHPSYNAFDDGELFAEEKKKLQDVFDIELNHGRQHFLRCKLPDTLNIWEDNGMIWDSSVSYADMLGFRAGTCRGYRPFDVKARKTLNLIERPTTVMDVTLNQYMKLSSEAAIDESLEMLAITKAYQGDFVLLWHNSSFFTPQWMPYSGVLESIVGGI